MRTILYVTKSKITILHHDPESITELSTTGLTWIQIQNPDKATFFKSVSVGRSGVWALDTSGKLWLRQGIQARVYKVPNNLIFFPIPIDIPSKLSVPFPSSSLDILPNSLNIIGKMILLPLSLFSTLYSSSQPCYPLPLVTT